MFRPVFHNAEGVTEIPVEYRRRVLMLMGLGILPFLVPFAFISAWQQRLWLAGLIGIVCSCCGWNAWAIRRGKAPPIPLLLQYGAILVALLHGMATVNSLAVFWAYPVPLTYHFVCLRREARMIEIVYLLSLLPTAFYYLGWDTASRFVITFGLVCVFTNLLIRVIIELQSRLVDQANRDPLTGVFNRRFLSRALRVAAHRTRQQGPPVSLIMLDVDHFKQVNDQFGHEAGDRVLAEVALLLKAGLRPLDDLFRSGGEEFTLLLPETPLLSAQQLADSLRLQVAQARILPDHTVSISLGVAELNPTETINAWCRRADEHLYEAKAAGRNCIRPEISPPSPGTQSTPSALSSS